MVAALAGTSGFWPLVGMRAAFGLAQAAAYPVISKITRSWFARSTRTAAQGVITALGRVGAACAPLLVATLLLGQLHFSWQSALLTIAMPGGLLAVGFWIAFRDSPSEHPWTNRAEQELIEEGDVRVAVGKRGKLRLDSS